MFSPKFRVQALSGLGFRVYVGSSLNRGPLFKSPIKYGGLI